MLGLWRMQSIIHNPKFAFHTSQSSSHSIALVGPKTGRSWTELSTKKNEKTTMTDNTRTGRAPGEGNKIK